MTWKPYPCLLALVLAAACSSGTPAKDDGKLSIVSTVAPVTSIVANIAGDKATITGVVPEGTNSHTFEPPPQIAKVMERADVVFVNGLQLEEPTYDLAKANAPKGATIVRIGEQVLPASDYIYDFSFPEKDGKPNPHLWTDPLYAIKYAQVIEQTLSDKDRANASSYKANLTAFTAKATALSDALKADQATIPGGKKELLTYHDAYA
ncbi:MAG: periplasmic solute binding protein, partial [Frankiales bacterium]|nr:periplasmic solute binding protein [Frankiales bacterium]